MGQNPRVFKVIVAAAVLIGISATGAGQVRGRGYAPVIVETPWGQHTVPELQTYIDMQVYTLLKPKDDWCLAGEPIRNRLREEYKSGQLKLRRFPWQVTDGIYALGRDALEQQIYLLDTGKGLLLIDPSYDSWQDTIIQEIRKLGYDPSQVRWVLVTHCHVDHAQSCHFWRTKGAKICVGDEDVHPVESGNQITAWWLEDGPDRHFTGCPVDLRIYDGDQIQFGDLTLSAIATPGHTPGATCYHLYHSGKHVLFSGDIALHAGRHAWMGNPYVDWDQYLKSLEKLSSYAIDGKAIEFDLLLPGHGTVDLDGAQRSIRETVKIVRNIVARRQSGERIDWVEPYVWNWAQGIRYRETKEGQPSH